MGYTHNSCLAYTGLRLLDLWFLADCITFDNSREYCLGQLETQVLPREVR